MLPAGRALQCCSHALPGDCGKDALRKAILRWFDVVHGDIDLPANQALPQELTGLKQIRYLIKGAGPST